MPRSRPRILRIARVRVRRLARRLDRETPGWVKWLTPWGTSLALHALFLFLLAIVVNALGHEPDPPSARFSGQLTDDLTSLRAAERAGDSFTTLSGPEPPSLSLEARPPADAEIRLPRLPDSLTLGPNVNLVAPREIPDLSATKPSATPKAAAPGRSAASRKFDGLGSGVFDARTPLMAPFSGRQGEERSKMVRREGGTVESEKAVEAGLDWIARHQRPDGGWSLDIAPMCKGAGCPGSCDAVSDTAATGLALLPLLAAGHTHTQKGRYQTTLQRGLLFLMKTQRPTGELYVGGSMHTLYYSHAIASMALCEAYGLTGDKALRSSAQKAIGHIARTQNRLDGGWRYEPGQPGDTSVFGWEIFALRSAHLAGLEVSKPTLRRAREFLDHVGADPKGATYSYMADWGPSHSMTAEALVCRQLLGWPRDHPSMQAGTAIVAAHLQESQQRNIYYWYYATQLLHNMRNKDWERWNVRVRDGLISMQTTSANCDRGSWDPSDPQLDLWGTKGGRLYTTSLSLLTLEVYYRYLPLYRDDGRAMAGADREPADEGEKSAK